MVPKCIGGNPLKFLGAHIINKFPPGFDPTKLKKEGDWRTFGGLSPPQDIILVCYALVRVRQRQQMSVKCEAFSKVFQLSSR